MSSHQMVCHLGDSFLMMLGERAVSEATSFAQRTFVKWIALYAPMPWPAGIPTVPEVDQKGGGTAPGDFTGDVAKVEMLMVRVCDRAGNYAPRHPIFGPMSEAAWFRWAYLHTDHHLRQFGV